MRGSAVIDVLDDDDRCANHVQAHAAASVVITDTQGHKAAITAAECRHATTLVGIDEDRQVQAIHVRLRPHCRKMHEHRQQKCQRRHNIL